jgi:Sulfotransferase domain
VETQFHSAIDPNIATTSRLPDFIIIGAAKSGTNTLRTYLSLHPDLFVANGEPSFYTFYLERGFDWYRERFAQASESQLWGECSTNYSMEHFAERTAELISRARPDTKIIFLMRHPVSRAYSHYVHLMQRGGAKEAGLVNKPAVPYKYTFEEFMDRNPICVECSDYLSIIRRYLAFFPRESLLLLVTKPLSDAPQETARRAFRFLGVDETVDVASDTKVVVNATDTYVDDMIRAKLIGGFTKPRIFRTVLRALPEPIRAPLRETIYSVVKLSPVGRRVRQNYTSPPMKPETRRMLIDRFAATNHELSELTGVDLSHWLK